MGQECNLCDGFVNFVADTDVAATVKFGAIQKHVRKLGQRGAPTDLSTLVLVQGDEVRPQPLRAPSALSAQPRSHFPTLAPSELDDYSRPARRPEFC